MRPDLMIMYVSQDVLRERLGALGIRLHPFTHGNVEHSLADIIEMGKTVGAEARGREIVGRIRETFDELRKTAPAVKPTVLLVHNRGAGLLGSFYSVGSKAFQSELIDIAGGRNVFSDLDREILEPSLEEVIRRGPEVVIETIPSPASAADIAQREKDWQTLSKLPAVTHRKVHVVAEDYMLVPGPRLDLAAMKFAQLIRGGGANP